MDRGVIWEEGYQSEYNKALGKGNRPFLWRTNFLWTSYGKKSFHKRSFLNFPTPRAYLQCACAMRRVELGIGPWAGKTVTQALVPAVPLPTWSPGHHEISVQGITRPTSQHAQGLDESHAKRSPMFLTYMCSIHVSYCDYKTTFNIPCSSSSQATKMAQDSCGLLKTSGVGGRVFGWGEQVSLRQQLVRAHPSVSQRGQHAPARVSLGPCGKSNVLSLYRPGEPSSGERLGTASNKLHR